jgi:hypothetical protein
MAKEHKEQEHEESFEDDMLRDTEQELLELQGEINDSMGKWRKRWIDNAILVVAAIVGVVYLFTLSFILGLVALVVALWFGLPRLLKDSPTNPIFTFDVTGKRLKEFILILQLNAKNTGYPETFASMLTFGNVKEFLNALNTEKDKEAKRAFGIPEKMDVTLDYIMKDEGSNELEHFLYTDKKHGFSISFPGRWIVSSKNEAVGQMMSVAEKDKDGYNFPFLFIFFKDFFKNYKDDGQMGPNISIGKVKRKTNEHRKDFDLQLTELPSTIPGYHEVNREYDDKKNIGKIEMISTIGDMQFRMIQQYHYPDKGDAIVLTFPPSSERKGVPSEELDWIIDSFKFI